MLSLHYREIKGLRSTGRCEEAIALLSTAPPTADHDAFEAVMCLLVCGQVENAVHVCRTYGWKIEWARQVTMAMAETLTNEGPDQRAVSFARSAVAAADAPSDVAAVLLLILRKNGFLEEADAYVRDRWPDPVPGETFLMTMIAEIAAAAEDWRQAYRFASAVLAADPDDYRALIAISAAHFGDGNLHEALGSALRAHALNPGAAVAILHVMRCHNQLGDRYAVVSAFAQLADPGMASAQHHIELGKAYAGLGRRDDAVAAYRSALALPETPIEALRALASMHATAGEAEEVSALAQSYAAQFTDDAELLYFAGLARLQRRELDAAHALFRRAFQVSDARGDAMNALPWPVPEPRWRHEYEQLDLLQRRGRLDAAARTALDTLKKYTPQAGDPRTRFAPAGAEADALRRALTAPHYVPDAPFTQAALGNGDYPALEAKYAAHGVVVIDDFLSAEALKALREFSEEASVWKTYNRHGYVGALLMNGFCPRVLLAIADQLRHAMPRVIGDLPLLQAWAFKYDQRMQGINMHADFARVNVNFWITADAASEDTATGGLVVFDTPAPKSWTFADYNSDPGRLAAYVKLHDAKPVRVPYRENRCVMFDSALMHVTDEIHFRPGYENRRVNVTLLYGQGLSVA